MNKINSFAVLGGDKRLIYCGRSMQEDGYSVFFCGFEKCGEELSAEPCKPIELINNCDAIILPLPCTRDGAFISTPFSDKPLPVSLLAEAAGFKPVFCGMSEKLPFSGKNIFDYSKVEGFAAENAILTAEGAIELAMRETENTINGSDCLVTGSGRIARVLCSMLKGLGARVTAAARNAEARVLLKAEGINAVSISDMGTRYDIIFNTVPSMLFDRKILKVLEGSPLITDLASAPYGVDINAAQALGLRAVRALSLPGKTAPKKAGIIIKNAVYHILGEEL